MSRRILVVEADPVVRGLIASVLAADSSEVVSCGTGREALEADDAGPADLVVGGSSLPDMEGLAVFVRLRERRPVPILVCTALDMNLPDAFRGAQTRTLRKPFGVGALRAEARILLGPS